MSIGSENSKVATKKVPKVWDTRELQYNADSVEISKDGLVAVGTYQLDEISRVRMGKLYLYDIETHDKDLPLLYTLNSQKIFFSELRIDKAEFECDGILDMKWKNSAGSSQLGIATAKGKLSLLSCSKSSFEWEHLKVADSEDVLCLSLDWSTRRHLPSNNVPDIAISLSDGSCSIIRQEPGGLKKICGWKAHDFEAWICAFNCYDSNIVYSGGDDSFLCGWDIRSCSRIFRNSSFSMGVTSIQHNPHREYQFTVGSYNEKMALFDTRSPRNPISEVHVGGGVWRIKWNDSDDKNSLATASMHDGFHVFSIDSDSSAFNLKQHYTDHSSLGYGIDWVSGISDTLVSCSFYDKAVKLWSIC